VQKPGSWVCIKKVKTLVRYCDEASAIVNQPTVAVSDRTRQLVEHLESKLEDWQNVEPA
jgi:hypothetical protein